MSNRTPLKTRVQSPGHHLLTPNDDDYERAQVRKARAAALRRKSGIGAEIAAAGFGQATPSQDDFGVLSREHILELHNNCIKLAAENVRVHLAHACNNSYLCCSCLKALLSLVVIPTIAFVRASFSSSLAHLCTVNASSVYVL